MCKPILLYAHYICCLDESNFRNGYANYIKLSNHHSYINVTGSVKLLMQSRHNIPPSYKRGKGGLEDLKIMLYLL